MYSFAEFVDQIGNHLIVIFGNGQIFNKCIQAGIVSLKLMIGGIILPVWSIFSAGLLFYFRYAISRTSSVVLMVVKSLL